MGRGALIVLCLVYLCFFETRFVYVALFLIELLYRPNSQACTTILGFHLIFEIGSLPEHEASPFDKASHGDPLVSVLVLGYRHATLCLAQDAEHLNLGPLA